MHLTVYAASSTHLDAAHHAIAGAVGAAIASRGWTMVYGGGGIGLMGETARAAKAGGARVVGVITQSLLDREQGWDGCDELHVVTTMQQRKRIMLDRADAFLVLPGGLGTVEEFVEALTARIVGEHAKPIGLVNAHGFWDPFLAFVEHGIAHRFIKPAVHELLVVDADPHAVLERLAAHEPRDIPDARLLPMGDA